MPRRTKSENGVSEDYRLIPEQAFSNYREYLQAHGPLTRVLTLSPTTLLQTLFDSGLRGRGGAGFPTGQKWQTIFQHDCPVHDVVCNAAEGEPGVFKDRFLLRKNPYATLEGMAIACRVVNARAAYLAIKASFTKELAILKRALSEVQATGLFGETPFHLVAGPEEYLFGEEKALLNVIENEGPLPRTPEEPPYEVGLFATVESPNPALINNAQTFAHVATIARHGAAGFRSTGTEDTPGNLLVTLCGDVARPGVYEIPSGLSLDKILENYGGVDSKRVKTLLPGVSAAAIPAKLFKTRAEFGALQKIGSGLGAAGFIVIGKATPIFPVLQSVTRFLYVESCNQCSACKAGLRVASQSLDEIAVQKPTPYEWTRIREAAEGAPQGNRCYLPVQAAHLIPSLLKHFANELRKPIRPQSEWLLPKILDYDEVQNRFSYDSRQALKQPDWTYSDEPKAATKRD